MKTLPPIMQHPEAVRVTASYRQQIINKIAEFGVRADSLNRGSGETTMLATAIGAIDAGICSILTYHHAKALEFSDDEFREFIAERLLCAVVEVRRQLSGGGSVQ